jgi:glycyl-tRNA synthetase beta chain
MKDFLLEIQTEELPPKLLLQFMQSLADNVAKDLKKCNLTYQEIKPFATPRRLAVIVIDLAEKQDDIHIDKKGPSVTANENAIQGFAKSNGVSVESLIIEHTDKGDYYYFKDRKQGQYTKELLANISENAIKNIPITRPMRWADNEFSFIRPVHSLILLFGDEVIPATIMNLSSGNTTKGLRFAKNTTITIPTASSYEQVMLDRANIQVDFVKRKATITEQINTLVTAQNLEIIENQALLDEVCSLVEYPQAFLGQFDKKFLDLPEEVIVLSMAEHQKYFATKQAGNLTNYFIAIANNKSQNIDVVIKGNEKVVRPRLEDGEFFWNTDKKTSLESKLEKLKTVVFMQGLGSMFDRVERIQNVSGFIAEKIGASVELSKRAGQLAKADLVSEMVGEFASLQGIMGGYYAALDGENEQVATAIAQHYQPKFAGDDLPSNNEGVSVAIADKIDSICGMFAIGNIPTGSKDPYSLRRLALGVMRMCIEKKLAINLQELIKYSLNTYDTSYADNSKLIQQILEFMNDRLKGYYKDLGIQTTSFIAAKTHNSHLVWDMHQRIIAIDTFAKTGDGESLIALNKRIKGILQGVKYQENTQPSCNEEQELWTQLEKVNSADYEVFMQELLQLKAPLDTFFENIVVNDEDENIRNARLTLLQKVADKFNTLGDISDISDIGSMSNIA